MNFSGSILNDSDILDKMGLEKIFRDMKRAEFYRLSRELLEKTRNVGFEIIISMIKIRKICDRFFFANGPILRTGNRILTLPGLDRDYRLLKISPENGCVA